MRSYARPLSGLVPRSLYVQCLKAWSNGKHSSASSFLSCDLRDRRSNEGTPSAILEFLIATPNIPNVLVHRIATLLFERAISSAESASDLIKVRLLLVNIQQRHSSIFHTVADEICNHNEDMKGQVEQLIITISMVRQVHLLFIFYVLTASIALFNVERRQRR